MGNVDDFSPDFTENVLSASKKLLYEINCITRPYIADKSLVENVIFMRNVILNIVGNTTFMQTNPEMGYQAYQDNADEMIDAMRDWFEEGLKQKFDELAGVKN